MNFPIRHRSSLPGYDWPVRWEHERRDGLSPIWDREDFCARFWAKVERGGADECWPWLASGVRGRGRIKINGLMYVAPRIAKVLADKRWQPDYILSCHSCDNPSCCNPAHIWWGSNQDNLRDAATKGRLPMQQRTHCERGHALAGGNIAMSQGFRRCRECRLIAQGKWREKQRSASSCQHRIAIARSVK